jgi:hypothetical protein
MHATPNVSDKYFEFLNPTLFKMVVNFSKSGNAFTEAGK